ncbi:DUF2786 domain-containing protein [Nocardioides baculatus]|uniref:DUF2786 domain-containing protein n=1 Tax=Nocardioides baculatus TaxID=2801337 RepID=A0ABS1LC29_9ACTN|nr:DUF2786 domain-containing protein [Nocardioides baculatus]MBL0749261.1 DUF2786 domain-containing protein [Nocardioides baculatus]
MGVNNRKRRAAKQRKQQRYQQQRIREEGDEPERPAEGWDAESAAAEVERHVHRALRALGRKKPTESEVTLFADLLLRWAAPYPAFVVEIVLHDAVYAVVAGGWSPEDLAQLVTRNVGPTRLPLLAGALREDERVRPRGQEWRDAIERMDDQPLPRVAHSAAVAPLLGLAALLRATPVLTDSIAATAASSGPEHPKLAKVRALLAKAESTEFDEEAEALTAKAQELISRYALDRLLAQGPTHDHTDVEVRRLWLDPPYVRPKTLLVSAVASANRCRAAGADRLGFSIVVGAAADLDAVELLLTSLLVQADAAMLRHGRRTSASGSTRTKSFRQSFLTAYATRIGERLSEANAVAARAAGAALLPVLRSQEVKVAEEFERLVPHSIGRAASVSNSGGWIAGLAAADLAALDVGARLNQAG